MPALKGDPARPAAQVPEALHAEVDLARRLVLLYLEDGTDLAFGLDDCPPLSGLSARAACDLTLAPAGDAILWPHHGLRLPLPGLLALGPARAIEGETADARTPARKAATRARVTPAEGRLGATTPFPSASVPGPMAILHGTWIPDPSGPFERAGAFHLWVETPAEGGNSPAHLAGAGLEAFLAPLLGPPARGRPRRLDAAAWVLPAAAGQPLPSPELGRWLEQAPPAEATLNTWQVATLRLADPLADLPALRFAALERGAELQLGADLVFWLHVMPAVKGAILRDQYVPALRLATAPTKGRGVVSVPDVRPGWDFVSAPLDEDLRRLAAAMPFVCRAASAPAEPAQGASEAGRGASEAGRGASTPGRGASNAVRGASEAARGAPEALPLLQHCAAVMLHDVVAALDLPQTFLKRVEGSVLAAAMQPVAVMQPAAAVPPTAPGRSRIAPRVASPSAGAPPIGLEVYRAWRGWRDRLARAHTATGFDLAFQLFEPVDEAGAWHLAFLALSRADPSLHLPLADLWGADARARARWRKAFGEDLERQALLALGQAARMLPTLWRGLETDRPAGLSLSLAEAHQFLKVDAWLLEDAGFKVIVPAWWTPEGRKRVRARLVPAGGAAGAATTAAAPTRGTLTLDSIRAFRYELAIGGEPVSAAEWNALVAAKAPLVRFRGEWVELDPAQMARVQALVEEHGDRPLALSPLDLVRIAAEAETADVALDESLEAIVARLADPRALTPVDPPAGLAATLRDYQRRGLDWLAFLDALGLNGCLADDMGLGKTVQVIARLAHEREQEPEAGPTLLVAPTSVVGNWAKELARFAPGLRALVHHGTGRQGEAAAFAAAAAAQHVVITSYPLIRRDEALFAGVRWRRVVLDEAQNIKNPAAAQTRAIRKLRAEHRLALTGTPVENRLLDLWSLFDFLNPGYLGKEAAFRKTFELPIQRDHDAGRAELLRRLTAPLVLRRLKTDPAVIRDLPDKIEQKLYCPLTPEQASLYEAVVKEAAAAVEAADGIKRKGVMLATLTRLKQVCNHPAQLLQDGSAFDVARSHKLARLTEHAHEILLGGESLLVFTQFAELGGQLERHLRHALGADVYFLHGGTPREARERMITTFQDPASGPAVFVLSLKAGGVGITLTKANHVFHFDRWWNPAVEEQATDRAFRIGQARNVFVHKFVTLGTLEERIDAMLEDKKRLAASVIGADESWLTTLDTEAFKALIALDRATVMA